MSLAPLPVARCPLPGQAVIHLGLSNQLCSPYEFRGPLLGNTQYRRESVFVHSCQLGCLGDSIVFQSCFRDLADTPDISN
jgi:hypothetical protein